jgi:hypothetical protein
MQEQEGEQGRPSQKSEGLGWDGGVCVVLFWWWWRFWWGRGKKHGGLKLRPGISRFNVGQDFFNLGVEGFGGVGCRRKVHHRQSKAVIKGKKKRRSTFEVPISLVYFYISTSQGEGEELCREGRDRCCDHMQSTL